MFMQVLTGALAFIGGMAVLLTVLTVIWIEGFGKAGRRGGRTGDHLIRHGEAVPPESKDASCRSKQRQRQRNPQQATGLLCPQGEGFGRGPRG